MSDATRSQLEQAYRLIQQEDLDKAIAILKPIVSAQPNNIDAWWLLSNAVSEPADARDALQNVLRLDPNHNQARDLLDALDQEFPEYTSSSFGSSAPQQFTPPMPQPGFSDTDDISSDDLDKLLGERYPSKGGVTNDEPFPQENEDFDQLFAQSAPASDDNPFDDPFASKDPGFVKGTDSKKKTREKKVKAPKPARQEKGMLDPLEVERRANSRTSPALLIGIILVIVIVIGGGLTLAFMTGLIGGSRGGQTATAVAANVSSTSQVVPPPAISGAPATAQASVAVSPATVEAIPSAATSEASSGGGIAEAPTPVGTAAASSTNDAISTATKALLDSFSAAKFKSVEATIVQSSLGDTLQVQICSSAGPSLQTNLNKAMDLIVSQAVTVKDSIKAAGVLIVNCAKPDATLVRDFAPIDAIVTYAGGNLADKKTYRASWIKS